MSTRTASGRSSAAYWISILAGLAALALLAVFVVVLPELDEADEASLPERLPGGFLALDAQRTVDPDAPASGETPPLTQEQVDKRAMDLGRERDYTDETLAEVVDGPVATRTYLKDGADEVLWVQVLGEELGPYVPAILRAPEVRGLARAPIDVERVDDTTTCVTEWAEVPEGQAFDEDESRGGVTCQRSEGGRTLRVAAVGRDVEETMEMLEVIEDEIG